MAEKFESREKGQPENEQSLEQILDVLEAAFEEGFSVELTVLEPSGTVRASAVFIEGLEGGMLFVSGSKDSSVMGIKIEDIKKAK